MIIKLSGEFNLISAAEWPKYVLAIENLLISHTEGWHVFVPTRETISELSKFAGLSAKHKMVLDVHIGEKLSILSGYARSAARIIVCVPDGVDKESTQNELVVRLRDFEVLENCLRSKFIVENSERDGRFYLEMANIALGHGMISSALSVEVVHGGGNTTAQRVREAVASPRPMLAVVDGDRRYPGCRGGDTARLVAAEVAESRYSDHVLRVTHVKSAENFIPHTLWPLMFAGREDTLRIVESIEKVIEHEHQEQVDEERSVVAFYCFKKGIKAAAFRLSDDLYKSNLKKFAEFMGVEITIPANDDPSRDDCYLVPGMNKNYLSIFLDKIEKDDGFRSACGQAIKQARFYRFLEVILLDLIAFGMALPRLPIHLESPAVAAA